MNRDIVVNYENKLISIILLCGAISRDLKQRRREAKLRLHLSRDCVGLRRCLISLRNLSESGHTI